MKSKLIFLSSDILIIYLNTKLNFDESTSTALYHSLNLLAFIFPIFAGVLADNYCGLFNTLIGTSFVFILGSITMALGAAESLNLPMV